MNIDAIKNGLVIDHIRAGNPAYALGVSLDKYPLAATCGRVCVRFCEQACRRRLVDGAVVNPVPISLARAMGAEVVIAVNLNTDLHQPWTDEPDEPAPGGLFSQWLGRTEPSTPGMWGVMTGSINIMQERITRARMAGDPPEIQLCPRLGNLSIMDFHRASDAINEGEACVERSLDQLKEELSRLGLL